MSRAEPMPAWKRRATYDQGDPDRSLTSRQARRHDKKLNREVHIALGKLGIADPGATPRQRKQVAG